MELEVVMLKKGYDSKEVGCPHCRRTGFHVYLDEVGIVGKSRFSCKSCECIFEVKLKEDKK